MQKVLHFIGKFIEEILCIAGFLFFIVATFMIDIKLGFYAIALSCFVSVALIILRDKFIRR